MGLFNNIRKIRNREPGKDSTRSAILASTYNKIHRRFITNADASSYIAKNMHKFYITSSKFSKGVQVKNLLRKIEISIPQEGFIYFLDEFKNLDYTGERISSIVDYSVFLDYSIYDLNEIFFNPKDGPGFKNQSSDYNKEMLAILDGAELLIYEINKKLARSSRKDKSKYIHFFEDMIDKRVSHFEEALQRILFINQLLYQTGHSPNSLGRLDKLLENLYFDDINDGYLTNKEAYGLIKDFINALNSYSWFKTDDSFDTACQIITIGGKYIDELGEYYFYNDLSYMFLEAIGELNPRHVKIALRLSYETPDDLIQLALKSINENTVYIEGNIRKDRDIDSNIIFSNDETVLEKLIGFGYEKEDAYNYVLSSLMEPTIISSLEENNLAFISLIKPLNDIFEKDTKEHLEFIVDYDHLLELYKDNLKLEIKEKIAYLDSIEWNEDPFLSLLSKESYENQLDISEGSSRYNNYGIRFYGMSNAVNSLYNLKKIVFEDKIIDLTGLNKMRKNNFKRKSYREVYSLLKDNPVRFGTPNQDIIDISNDLISFIEENLIEYRNSFGGRLKFGLSAPEGIIENDRHSSFDASLKDDLPANTFLSGEKIGGAIFDFASKLDYGTLGFNGNLIELNLSIDDRDNLKNLLVEAIGIGFHQLKINLIKEEQIVRETDDE